MSNVANCVKGAPSDIPDRRDFLVTAAATIGVVGVGIATWPLIDSMNPAADVRALSSIEVDLGKIKLGQRVTVKWRGKPVFIDHRIEERIAEARSVALAELKDPETDHSRATRAEWLIVVGICTHLGCVPLGQKSRDRRGEWGGWFCPCHGSHYDMSGRIRKGPAPRNLEIPPYVFKDNDVLRIG